MTGPFASYSTEPQRKASFEELMTGLTLHIGLVERLTSVDQEQLTRLRKQVQRIDQSVVKLSRSVK